MQFFKTRRFFKTLLVMKTTVLLIVTASLQLSAEGYGQQVTLQVKERGLAEVFREIRKQTGYQFLYNDQHLQRAKRVTTRMKDAPLDRVLQACFQDQPLSYRIVDKTIIVQPAEERKTPRAQRLSTTTRIDTIITGSVTDTTGAPLPGVSVTVKGTSLGTSTDPEGHYRLSGVPGDAVLVFRFIGYQTREIPAGGRQEINVRMRPDVDDLEEVVVIGYGTVKKSSVTAAISRVENEKLDQIPAGRPESALVGRMAGVNISQVRSSPGAAPTITVRGPGSISADNAPLIVIDGFPGGSFDNINMNDVESIEVLKDASSAAIYGSRGAGGVIIVTTKKGKEGKARLRFNSYAGTAIPMAHGKDKWAAGGQEFYDYTARYINRDYAWTGGDPSLPLWGDERRPAQYRVNPVIAEGNYNWEDILLDPALIQNYNLSVSGGRNNANYYVSGTFKDEQGNILNTGYKQYAIRANVNFDIGSRMRAGFMISPNYSERRTYSGGLQNLIKMPPFLSPEKQADGSYLRPLDYWGSSVSSGVNPLATLEGTHNYETAFNNVGELYGELTLLDGLSLRSSFGFNISYSTEDNFQESRATNLNRATGSASDFRTYNLINENVLNYSKIFNGVHNFTGILGASWQYELYRRSTLAAEPGSFANETIPTLNNAIISPGGSYTSKTQWGLSSYFARVNYGYDDKYLLSASIRTDGSSRFGPDTRWGYFPSASVAWRISQEDFFQNVPAINELKLRASYGVVGNFNIKDFQYLGIIEETLYSPDGELVQGQAQTSLGNPGLKWERTESYDIGLEIGLFDNRVSLVTDYYHKLTRDLLYNVSIPAISGFTNTIVNVGDIRNKGFEVELYTRNLIRDFQWQTTFNFSLNKNEVRSLGGGVEQVTNTHSRGMGWLLKKGEPMFSYYGYRQAGVIQSQEELESVPVIPGQFVGTVQYDDVNGDGVITPEDRVILGNFMPDFFMGMVNDFSWKNFDLSIAMQSAVGGKMYNLENLYYQGPTVSAFLLPVVENQWWSEAEPGDGKHPATSLAALEYVGNSDYYLENASFLAVRNINLGYTFPASTAQKLRLTNLRCYVSVSNALMLRSKDFNGYNPEGYTTSGISGVNSMPGLNNGTEPIPRIITLGLDVNF